MPTPNNPINTQISDHPLQSADGVHRSGSQACYSELDTTAKRRKMAIELGDMTKLQLFVQCRSLLSWRD